MVHCPRVRPPGIGDDFVMPEQHVVGCSQQHARRQRCDGPVPSAEKPDLAPSGPRPTVSEVEVDVLIPPRVRRILKLLFVAEPLLLGVMTITFLFVVLAPSFGWESGAEAALTVLEGEALVALVLFVPFVLATAALLGESAWLGLRIRR